MDDKEYNEFKTKLEEYIPIIPDSIVEYYMEKCGIVSGSDDVKKTITLISHKFLTDVAVGAFQYHKIQSKAAQKDKRFGREKKLTLQVTDLERALRDLGIDISRPYYYI